MNIKLIKFRIKLRNTMKNLHTNILEKTCKLNFLQCFRLSLRNTESGKTLGFVALFSGSVLHPCLKTNYIKPLHILVAEPKVYSLPVTTLPFNWLSATQG